ncbi:unnamed protein product [Hermetia illucens]|uniref:Uncharacterized protein n=1 Tax=Hermetia illucens TaxID=343691 RepID=A0A7R8UF54_HERIL|nr:phosphatidylinositol 4-phosphate 5-kinase 5-like [Hermetia illucens]CAD7079555.1 unnamed protein product [Hermetia illucens]
MLRRTERKSRKKDAKRNVPILIQTGKFEFENGDWYEGEYAMDSKSNTIFRQGAGTYTTAEGHVYEGKWLNDKLVIKAKVKFPTNAYFEGAMDETPTYTIGTYTFCDRCEITGDFKKLFNEGKNAATFTDPGGNAWDIKLRDGHLELMYPWDWKQSILKSGEDSCVED